MTYRVEHLLSAPLFLSPQIVGDRIYFISNLSGQLSLWAMDASGSVPEPLLPPDLAMLSPHLMEGPLFVALPDLGVIVVMLDRDGDELLQPCLIPISGGDPVPLFEDRFAGQQVQLIELDQDGRGTIWVDPRVRPEGESYHVDVATKSLVLLGVSHHGNVPAGHNDDRSRYLLVDEYTFKDTTLWLWERETGERRLLYGVPLDQRAGGEPVPLTGIERAWFMDGERSILLTTTLFDDLGGLGWLSLDDPGQIEPVTLTGAVHEGIAELVSVSRLSEERFALTYNVDGVSWGYEATLDEKQRTMDLSRVLWGQGELTGGVVQRHGYDRPTGRFAVAFSSASSPAQLARVDADGTVATLTRNRVLGIDPAHFSGGEDASYLSHDGLRISARLYLPSDRLGFDGPRPVAFLIHGGPQSQARPDFASFAMPLVQYLTLHGFAVFVPNVRGSTGYGQAYMKQVDRDWGGKDRLDHVAAVEHLRADPRLDTGRIGLIGGSYGGFMVLTLAGRHPELWSAVVDLFGPYDMLTFMARLPEAWQVSFRLMVGDPDKDRDELIERSPRTHLGALACPLLVIQGANDPRVTKAESDDLVAGLREAGKDVDYLVFDDEGHGFAKTANKARCYDSIATFLTRHIG